MRILLLQLKRIGDLVLTTPAIAAVRATFPEAEITLGVSRGCAELLPAIDGVESLIAGEAATFLNIARRRYDICVDFTHSDRSAFLTFLSKAPKRVTAAHVRVQSKLRALAYNELIDCSLATLHTVDYNLALLASLGIHDASPELRLNLPPAAISNAQQVLEHENIARDFIIVHPGAARIEKFWSAEGWSRVIDLAAERELQCVVTGSASPLEQSHIADIKRQAGAGFVDLSGKIDLLTFTALIKRARLLVTVDSAPVHLASATQTPQVALFGPTNPLHWHPRFTPAVILQAGSSEPATEFSPDHTPVETKRISTEQVIDGMKALLAAPRATSV